MSYCKANSCYNSTDYSWKDYCSYHERCLSKLREYNSSINNIKEVETFETYFNCNCGYVINYDYSASSSYPYYIWIVVYEPAVRSMGEKMVAIKYKCGYSGLSGASNKARRIKNKLQNGGWYDTPMLKIHPGAKNWKYFSNLIISPYVERKEVGSASVNNCLFYIDGRGTTPSNLDRYFKPLDIVKVREAHMITEGVTSGVIYYHVGIYLGDVGNGNRICHFSRENKGVRLTDWKGFLKDRIGELYRYHPMIPFKYPRRIAEQIAWAWTVDFRENNYNLRNRNCEHFANMVVYGINYSQQVEDKKVALAASVGVPTGVAVGATAGLSIWTIAGSIALAPATGGASLFFGAASALTTVGSAVAAAEVGERYEEINNGKGSTIKLVNEMSESNGKLGERDNWLSDRIKANIEVPTKEYCRIM